MSTAWLRSAACAEIDPEAMFPHPTDAKGIEDAKRICTGCPVRDQCLARALDPATRVLDGVQGGLTEDERKRLAKGRTVRYSVGRIPPPKKRRSRTTA
ncbi:MULTISPECIES: WhiB family transcriptional regulator [unclassified Streptomyces]|uniref:WhiB family transcriptional regulator n=1 Tax=unclassified Streptomyces TaxID=2593676 RepID=UPI00332636A5